MQPPHHPLLTAILISIALLSVAGQSRQVETNHLEGHPGIVYALAFSPNGKFIASGSGDKTIKFWDARTGKLFKSLIGHTSKINSIAFSRDGQRLASGGEDATIKIWNVKSGHLLRTINDPDAGVNGIKGVAFSSDGQHVIGGSSTKIKVWVAATGRLIRTFATYETHLSGDPNGVHVDVCCGSEVFSVSFGPRGMIVSAHEDGTIKLWDLRKAAPIRILKTQLPVLRAMTLSPDGRLVASGYSEGDFLDLWSVQSGKLVMQLGEHAGSVRSLAFSPDGRMIVSGHPSGLKLWDVKTGALLRQFSRPFSENEQVAFSPDSKRIVSGGENQNILLWDARTGRLLWSLMPVDGQAK